MPLRYTGEPKLREEAVPMAKDGTKRGGARPGAGRKKKPLVEKIQEGRDAVVMDTDGLESKEMPDVKEYLKADQAMGELHAAETYEEVWNWLKDRGCAELVSLQLIEQYSMSVARWIQLEQLSSRTGFVGKHPTTGAAIASPIVSMSQAYLKQANQLWYQIYQIVQENCSTPFKGNPHEDAMERLLSDGY